MAEDQRTGRDKAEHVFASAALAAAGNKYGQRQPLSGRQNQTIGILFSLNIEAGKEWYDSRPNGSGWRWKAFVWDAADATRGIALWNLSQSPC